MMKRMALDTNYYSAFKRGLNSQLLLPLQSAEYIGVSTVVLGELLGGFKVGGKSEKNLQELQKFLDSPRVFVNEMNEDTAELYSDIFQRLRKKRKPVPSNDMWIAASALQHGLSLLTLDDHFREIEGLTVIRPKEAQ
jgi:predicted nucleic acid-binding protein